MKCVVSFFPVLLLCALAAGEASADVLSDAVAALERGDFSSAEQALRLELRTQPNNTTALSLLGVALDNEKKYGEAGEVYRRAIALSPQRAGLLNNYANHLLATGDSAGARAAFQKVVALNPAHTNANLQLARIALQKKAGLEALQYLNHLPANDQVNPEAGILRVQALYESNQNAEGAALLERLSFEAQPDPRLSFSVGLALATAGQYERAETFFSRTLESIPADFDALYNLGLAASHAGHNDRAHDVLQAALEQHPQDLDVMYNLAAVDAALKQNVEAVRLLAQAVKLAPERADIQLLLAHTTLDLGALADSLSAWDRYRQLVPGDDVARRERGFVAALLGRRTEGIVDLEWYVRKHSDDSMGHYQLAVAQSASNTSQAFLHFDKALALKADFVAARFARGVLNYQLGKPAAALPDFEFIANREPENAGFLDRLGQAYLALDRPADAVRFLRKAAELAPQDSKILLHLGRSLADAGQHVEASVVMERFRQFGPDRAHKRLPAGLVNFLSLSPEEQYADYRARVEQAVRKDPADAEAQVLYLNLLLDDGNWQQAAGVTRQLLALKPVASILSAAGRALLEADRYALAKEVLEQAAGANPAPDVQLDVAIATFHVGGAKAGLRQMDRIAVAQRRGDYYLARAQMLDADGALSDAAMALNQALRAAPRRPELYRQATYFLIKNNNVPQALQLLDQATRLLPNNPELLLMKSTTLELARKTEEAESLLDEIQNRWPEWSNAWVAHGIILESHKRSEEARQMLETAVALGAHGSEAYFYLAESTLRASPERIDAAEEAIRRAVDLAPQDPWARALAGRIAFEKGHYQNAVEQLREAIRLRPHFVQAHYNLAQTYAALNRKQESRDELDQVTLIQEKFPHADEEAAEVIDALFRVKAPRD